MSRRAALRLNPFGTMTACAAVALGVVGVVIGQDVSQGVTNSLRGVAGPVAHLWGLELAIGGMLTLTGLYWRHSELEIPGLWMMCGGWAFYSITVVVGLGLHGMAAGIISAALTAGCLVKAIVITRAAARNRGEGQAWRGPTS